MSDIVEGIWGTVMAVVIYFLLIFFVLFSVESNINTNIKDQTSKFVNESCVSGEIDADSFLRYTKGIYKYGKYEVDVKIDKVRAYPAKDTNGNNTARMGYDTYSTDDVMKSMYPDDYKKDGVWVHPDYQDYELTAGDTITITIVRQNSITSGIYRLLFHSENKGTVITRYHNVVGYSYGT